MIKKIDNTLYFRGKIVFGNDRVELLTFLKNHLKSDKTLLSIFTPNPEQIVLAEHDKKFNEVLKSGDLLLPDGMGLVWASRILAKNKSEQIKERIAGRGVVEDLLQIAQNEQMPALVIGGRDYSQTGKIEIAGFKIDWLRGHKDVLQKSAEEEELLQEKIKQLRPKIIFVAFGAPEQEKWIVDHKKLLEKTGVRLAMAVGGSFDALLGKVPVAPAWVGKLGLEWLFRLTTQPWRWRRQLRLIEFAGLVLRMRVGILKKY